MRARTGTAIGGLAAAAAMVVVSPAAAAASQTYTFHTVTTTTPSGARCHDTLLDAVDNLGTILGTSYCGRAFAFLRHPDGSRTRYRLPAKYASYTYGAALASNGTLAVLGRATKKSKLRSYVVSKSGKVTRIVDPKDHGWGTMITGVNSHGRVVGNYCARSNCALTKPFSYKDGKYKDFQLHIKNAALATLEQINDHGTLVGNYFDSHNRSHGFLVRDGSMTTVTGPQAGTARNQGTFLYDVANNGSYVGIVIDDKNRTQGLVHRGGKSTLVNYRPPSTTRNTELFGINNSGTVCGSYTTQRSKANHGIFGTP